MKPSSTEDAVSLFHVERAKGAKVSGCSGVCGACCKGLGEEECASEHRLGVRTDADPGPATYKLHRLWQITHIDFSSLICQMGTITATGLLSE